MTTTAFEGAAVPQDAIDRLVPAMANDEKDRHVLAAAVVSDAQAVVTLNLKDFPVEACEPFAIEPLHPDVFLIDLYNLDAQEVFEAVERQAAVLRRPPMTLRDLIDRLASPCRRSPRPSASTADTRPPHGRKDSNLRPLVP